MLDIKDKYIKDQARRLVALQIRDEEYRSIDVMTRLSYLLRDLIGPTGRHVASYRALMDEVNLGAQFDYAVTTDLEAAKFNVKDILLVPVYGFTRRGNYRLGRGGGFYDRLISSNPSITTIGIATDAREVFFIPELHDQGLDFIVTQTRTLIR